MSSHEIQWNISPSLCLCFHYPLTFWRAICQHFLPQTLLESCSYQMHNCTICHFDHRIFTLIFPPLLWFCYIYPEEKKEWGEKRREWMKTYNTHSNLLNICFHFGVGFQIRARDYRDPNVETVV